MQIINPCDEHVPQLKEMWKRIFGDSKGYIDLFFNNIFSFDNTFIAVEGGNVLGMLYAVRLEMKVYKKVLNTAYLCGIATHEEHRGRGIAGRILEHSEAELLKDGVELCTLIPANKGLFDFYEKSGYSKFFKLNKITFKSDEKDYPVLKEINDTHRAFEIYTRFMANFDIASLKTEEFFRIIKAENSLSGGRLMVFDGEILRGYAFVLADGENALIREYMFEQENGIDIFSSYLAKTIKAENISIISPAKGNDGDYDFAMIKLLQGNKELIFNTKSRYFNMMLN